MRKKSNIEKQNDALLFWEVFGPIIYRIVGVIVVVSLFVAFFSIKGVITRHSEKAAEKQQQELTLQRQDIVDAYISNNSKTFGSIYKQWNNGNLFFVESEYGEFTIAFNDTDVSKVLFENKAGKLITLYEK